MLKGFEHMNLTTSDMDRTLVFYRDLLGMREVVRRDIKGGGEIAFVEFPGGDDPDGRIQKSLAYLGRG